jgi:hypothetical protein
MSAQLERILGRCWFLTASADSDERAPTNTSHFGT